MGKCIDVTCANDIYPIIGDGLCQVIIVGVICLLMIPSGIPQFVMIFLGQTPEWVFVGVRNNSSPQNDICKLNKSEWKWTRPVDYSIISEFDLYCEREHWVHVTTMLYFVFAAIGSFMMGYFADRFGRKFVLATGLFLNIVVGSTCGFAINFPMFMILKSTAGFFGPGIFATMVVYTTEVVSERKRTVGSMAIWIAFPIGILLLILTSYITQTWRKVMFYTTIPYIFVLGLLLFVPETPPWLYQHGKLDTLKKTMAKIMIINRRKNHSNINFIEPKNPKLFVAEKKADFRLLFSTVKMTVKTISLIIIWMNTAMTFLGISLAADDLTGNLYRDLLMLTLSQIVAGIMSIILGARFGQKKTCITCLFFTGICLVVVATLPYPTKNKVLLHSRLAFGVMGKFMCNITYNLICTWTAEVYPTFIRTCAVGFLHFFGYMGMMAAPWVAVWLKRYYASLPFYSLGGAAILGSLLMLNIAETKGKKLAENVDDEAEEKLITKVDVSKQAAENKAYSIDDLT